MQKILFLTSQFHKGGAESSLLNLICGLDKDLYDISMIVMNHAPVKGAISLIDKLPAHVHLCHAYAESHKGPFLLQKVYSKLFENAIFPEKAIKFVAGKKYDIAVHVGEWWNPLFLANVVQAKRKAVWIHADINRALGFDADGFFACDEKIDEYWFVSKKSMEESCKKYVFIESKCSVLHNQINRDAIVRLSNEKTSQLRRDKNRPLIVSVANLRTEKGHLRSLEALRILKNQGYDIEWWNIGSFSSYALTSEIKEKIDKYDLKENFLLLGAYDNVYPLLKQADIVACLSDYESWSLVITEAKALGKPVVATQTSGAMEQINNGETGVIVGFDTDTIVEGIKSVLPGSRLCHTITERLKDPDSIPNAVKEFTALTQKENGKEHREQDILYVIDNVNYSGGAHIAAFRQIQFLMSQGFTVDIYSSVLAGSRVREQLPNACHTSYSFSSEYILLNRKLIPVLLDRHIAGAEKKLRIRAYAARRKNEKPQLLAECDKAYLQQLASEYNSVCVLSEGSMYKKPVAECSAKNKIQWIHTDYSAWHSLNEYTESISKEDAEIWNKMDKIVVLAPVFKQKLSELYPSLKNKIDSIGNLVNLEQYKKKAMEPAKMPIFAACDCSRMSADYVNKTIEFLKKKKEEGYYYKFYFINAISDIPFEGLDTEGIYFYNEQAYRYEYLKNATVVIFNGKNQAIKEVAEVLGVVQKLAVGDLENNEMGLPSIIDVMRLLFDHVLDVYREKEKELIKRNLETKKYISSLRERYKNDEILERLLVGREIIRLSEADGYLAPPVHFITCFRFEPIKNALKIIEVLQRVKDRGYAFHWTFVGNGEQYSQAIDKVNAYGLVDNVEFVGYQENPYPFIRQADVFVLFSKYEGLPNTIYEAFSLGVPVLASDVGAVSTQVKDGENGWLIRPSLIELEKKIIWIITHPKEVEERKAVLSHYSFDNHEIEKKLISVFSTAKPRKGVGPQ